MLTFVRDDSWWRKLGARGKAELLATECTMCTQQART